MGEYKGGKGCRGGEGRYKGRQTCPPFLRRLHPRPCPPLGAPRRKGKGPSTISTPRGPSLSHAPEAHRDANSAGANTRTNGTYLYSDTNSDTGRETNAGANAGTYSDTCSDTNSGRSGVTSSTGGGTGGPNSPGAWGRLKPVVDTSATHSATHWHPHLQAHQYSQGASRVTLRKDLRAGREEKGQPQKDGRTMRAGSPISQEEGCNTGESLEHGVWGKSLTVPRKLPGNTSSQAGRERASPLGKGGAARP